MRSDQTGVYKVFTNSGKLSYGEATVFMSKSSCYKFIAELCLKTRYHMLEEANERVSIWIDYHDACCSRILCDHLDIVFSESEIPELVRVIGTLEDSRHPALWAVLITVDIPERKICYNFPVKFAYKDDNNASEQVGQRNRN